MKKPIKKYQPNHILERIEECLDRGDRDGAIVIIREARSNWRASGYESGSKKIPSVHCETCKNMIKDLNL